MPYNYGRLVNNMRKIATILCLTILSSSLAGCLWNDDDVGISFSDIKKGLSKFKGVQRRFNKIFTYNGVDFFDDYAHHPTEIKVVLEGVNKVYEGYDKICVFQPHRISRLKDCLLYTSDAADE